MRTNVTDISKYYLEEVLAKGKQFPKDIWNYNSKYDNAKVVTKTLIEKVLKWSDEDVRKKLSVNIFRKNSLIRMLTILFNGSPYGAIENAYPGKFKQWELPSVPKNFWNMETAKEATIWLIEEKLKWSDDDIKQNLSLNIFKENSLDGMLFILFNNSPYFAIENAYPGKFKPWEFSKVPNNFWNLKTASEATIWLIEEKLKWSDDDIKQNLSLKIFKENSLVGMLNVLFNSSPYLAIENAYPGKFKPWEFTQVPNHFWNLKTASEATTWLIEEKLKWSDEDVRKKISVSIFKKNLLGGMLTILFNNSPYLAIENAYPGKFKPWELPSVQKKIWNMEKAKEATMWLIEEKLKWGDEDVRRNLSKNTFKENSLVGMLDVLFNGSPYFAIENAYPGKFKPWEFSKVPKNFWNMETAKEATMWLIEEKLKWSDEDLRRNLSQNTFKENSLTSINSLFNGSPYLAIENAYPGKFKPWEFKRIPNNFWNLKTAREATIWLIEEKLKWSDDDIRHRLSKSIFRKNSLGGMLAVLFNDSPYRAIENAYPGKFKPWELPSVPKKIWNVETAREATIWLIEEKLKWSDEDVKEKLSANTFIKNSLTSIISLFNGSPYLAIENAYPGKFKPWEVARVSKNFWNMETAREATIWLIEEKLKWSDEDVKKKINLNTFKENSLKSMLNYLFNIDPHQAVEMHLKINSKDLTLIFNNNNLIIK